MRPCARAWDPNFSPPPVANDRRRFDNTGDLRRPIVMAHGSHDPIVSPGETAAYKQLVELHRGVAGARNWLAVYGIPGMSHAGAEYNATLSAQLDVTEAWVTWHQTGGTSGALPPDGLAGGLGTCPRDWPRASSSTAVAQIRGEAGPPAERHGGLG